MDTVHPKVDIVHPKVDIKNIFRHLVDRAGGGGGPCDVDDEDDDDEAAIAATPPGGAHTEEVARRVCYNPCTAGIFWGMKTVPKDLGCAWLWLGARG